MTRLGGADTSLSKISKKKEKCKISEAAGCSDEVVPSSQEDPSVSELSNAQTKEPWCSQPDLALAICETRAYYRTYFKIEADRPQSGKCDEKLRTEYRNLLSADLALKKLVEMFADRILTYEKKHETRAKEHVAVQASLGPWEKRVEVVSLTALPYCIDDSVLDYAVDMLRIQYDEKSAAAELELDLDPELLDTGKSVSELSLAHYERSVIRGSIFNKHSLTLIDNFLKQRKLLESELALNNNKLRELEKRLRSIKTKVSISNDSMAIPNFSDYIEQMGSSTEVLSLQDLLEKH